MTRSTATLLSALLLGYLAGCRNDKVSDGYGNFEATEIVVSSESSGRLVRYEVDEGLKLDKGAVVAVVDTTQLDLDRRHLKAQYTALSAQQPSIEAEA
ncbi:MAG: HlyD family secretion protein, partial [Chlorobiales bacterium]|nr:HlyD family secretion protein [Chlorobiales bacterium]